jgi:hypothetical protein
MEDLTIRRHRDSQFEDYSVLFRGHCVGRIHETGSMPMFDGKPGWFWGNGRTPSGPTEYGYAATFDAAKAAWRAAWYRYDDPLTGFNWLRAKLDTNRKAPKAATIVVGGTEPRGDWG